MLYICIVIMKSQVLFFNFKLTAMAKVNEVLKLLVDDGWYLHKHGKRHDLYRHPTKKGQIPVPRHGSKEMAKGTLNSILKAAGLK